MKKKIVLLGASTGGPSLIKEILASLQTLHSTFIIAQHMKEDVLPFFIKELQASFHHLQITATPCKIDFSTPSIIVCAKSSIFVQECSNLFLKIQEDGQKFTPDINKLFLSFVPYAKEFDASVIIMTGMGHDGVEGARELKEQGVHIIPR